MNRTIFLILFCILSFQANANTSRYLYHTVDSSNHFIDAFSGAYKSIFPVKLSLYLDPTFSSSAQSVIRSAVEVFINHVLNPSVLDCAYRNATKDLPSSRERFERDQLFGSLSLQLLGNGGEFFLTPLLIGRIWDESSSVGLGYVNFFGWVGTPMRNSGQKRYFYIGLNSDFLGEESSYTYANSSTYWAGVIAHEVLHNLGYTHPTGYAGSFINEFGNCLHWHSVGRLGGSDMPESGEIMADRELFLPY